MSTLSKSDINHIRTSLSRCDAEGLARELGRAKEKIEAKIREIREEERISKMGGE